MKKQKGELWMCVESFDSYKEGEGYLFINKHDLIEESYQLSFRKPTQEEIIDYFSKSNGELTTCTVKPITISEETVEAMKREPLSTLMNKKPERPMNYPPKPEQLYKLKEEIKKYYVAPNPDAINTMDYWKEQHLLPEALEPVESRVTIVRQNGGALLKIRHDGEPIDFTEQERKDIEHLINEEYGEIKGLLGLVWEYGQHIKNKSTKMMDVGDTFDWWLKKKPFN